MKTKTASQAKKPAAAAKVKKPAAAAKPKIEPKAKYVPGEDEIREKAREIYFERISRGEHGTPEDDWREAEELLMGY
jgi:hypothetical protein